jgi:hypothetical protein
MQTVDWQDITVNWKTSPTEAHSTEIQKDGRAIEAARPSD